MKDYEVVIDAWGATKVNEPGPYCSIENQDGILLCKVFGIDYSDAAQKAFRISHLLNLYGLDGMDG